MNMHVLTIMNIHLERFMSPNEEREQSYVLFTRRSLRKCFPQCINLNYLFSRPVEIIIQSQITTLIVIWIFDLIGSHDTRLVDHTIEHYFTYFFCPCIQLCCNIYSNSMNYIIYFFGTVTW